jgi:hypothetical protein
MIKSKHIGSGRLPEEVARDPLGPLSTARTRGLSTLRHHPGILVPALRRDRVIRCASQTLSAGVRTEQMTS